MQSHSHEAKRVARVCQVCGKEFSVIQAVAKKHDSGKYCSKECSDAAKRDYVALICGECGKQFFLPRSQLNRGKGKFCSKECFNTNIYAQVKLTCKNCGKEFVTHKSNADVGRQFCSLECYHKKIQTEGQLWYREQPDADLTLTCVRCGKAFRVKSNKKRRFCSFTCQLLYRGETSIEQLIREELEKRVVTFDTQVQIGKFNVDFLLDGKKVIECDGEYWHSLPQSKARDYYKDSYLFEKGYQVFRFTESEIRKSPSDCLDRVLKG